MGACGSLERWCIILKAKIFFRIMFHLTPKHLAYSCYHCVINFLLSSMLTKHNHFRHFTRCTGGFWSGRQDKLKTLGWQLLSFNPQFFCGFNWLEIPCDSRTSFCCHSKRKMQMSSKTCSTCVRWWHLIQLVLTIITSESFNPFTLKLVCPGKNEWHPVLLKQQCNSQLTLE